MHPMGSYQPRLTPAVKALLISLGVVFLLQLICSRFVGVNPPLEVTFGFSPHSFLEGKVWQVVTYPFLHGSLTHLFFNAFALYMFGADLESRWGTKKFLKYYALCATGGAALQILVWLGAKFAGAAQWADFLGNTPILGASGALYGLLMAFGFFYGDTMMLLMLVVPVKTKHAVAFFFVFEILMFLFYTSPSDNGGVAHLVHLGGLITGYLYLRWTTGGGGGFFRRKKKMDRDEVRRRLSLVVNHDEPGPDGKYPITWN